MKKFTMLLAVFSAFWLTQSPSFAAQRFVVNTTKKVNKLVRHLQKRARGLRGAAKRWEAKKGSEWVKAVLKDADALEAVAVIMGESFITARALGMSKKETTNKDGFSSKDAFGNTVAVAQVVEETDSTHVRIWLPKGRLKMDLSKTVRRGGTTPVRHNAEGPLEITVTPTSVTMDVKTMHNLKEKKTIEAITTVIRGLPNTMGL